MFSDDNDVDHIMCLDMNVPTFICFVLFFSVPAVPLGELVPVSTTKTLLLSAYQEHRSGKKEVSDKQEIISVLFFFLCPHNRQLR